MSSDLERMMYAAGVAEPGTSGGPALASSSSSSQHDGLPPAGEMAVGSDGSSEGASAAGSDEDAFLVRARSIIRRHLRVVPDYPKPGVHFKDMTSILLEPAAFAVTIEALARRYRDAGITHVVAIESRGFLLGAPLALALQCAFAPVRKPRKLPCETVGIDFSRHFTENRLEMHADALGEGARVIVIDDIVSTGMTLEASAQLVEMMGGEVVELACVAELPELNGRARLGTRPLFTLCPDPEAEAGAAAAEGAAHGHGAGVGEGGELGPVHSGPSGSPLRASGSARPGAGAAQAGGE